MENSNGWKSKDTPKGSEFTLQEIYPVTNVEKLRYNLKNKNIYNLFTKNKSGLSISQIKKDYRSVITKLNKMIDQLQPSSVHHSIYTLPVKYYQVVKERGRHFARDSLGYQGIPRFIRGFLCRELYHDIDMKNAHPNILLQFMEKAKLPLNKSLKHYIEHREEVLASLLEHTDAFKSREEAKTLLLSIMNGGEVCNFKVKKIPFVSEYYKDMRETIDAVYDFVCKTKEYKKYKSNKADNTKGSTLNNVLCDIENTCLYHMYNCFLLNGFKVGTLCFDGLMIEKGYDPETDTFYSRTEELVSFLPTVEEYTHNQCGYNINLEEKPFDESLKMEDLKVDKDEPVEIPTMMEILEEFHGAFGKESVVIVQPSRVYIYDAKSGLWVDTPKNSLGSYIARYMSDYYSDTVSNIELFEALRKTVFEKPSKIKDLGRTYFDDITFQTHPDMISRFNRTRPYLVPFKDKVVDIRTKKIRGLKKEDYFTFTIDRDYTEYSQCNDKGAVESFIQSFFHCDGELDMETYQAFQRILGYSLTGYNSCKCLFILLGDSNSGKSTMIKLLEKTLNSSLVKPVHKRLFVGQQGNIESEYSVLEKGIRIGHCSEFNENERLNSSVVKMITGNDTISYRPFGETTREFEGSITKFFILSNEMPSFKSIDTGLETRLVFVPFRNVFDINKGVKVVEGFFRDHLDCMFSFLVEQAHLWYTSGQEITQSKAMLELKDEIKNEKNPLSSFFEDFRETNDESEYIPSWKVYQLYKETPAYRQNPLSQKGFEQYSKKIFINKMKCNRVINGKRTTVLYKYTMSSPSFKETYTDSVNPLLDD